MLNTTLQEITRNYAMRKVFNFSPGPAMLPEEVLLKAQAELLDWHGTGMSIMEVSHRGPEFKEIAEKSEADLRELMAIPKNYRLLFLGGGASTQFAMVPLNLFGDKKTADYIDTGVWSKKAIAEAKRFGTVHIAAQTAYSNEVAYIPPQTQWSLNENAAYVHYTPNETIEGIEFHWVPEIKDIPLVADMTSTFLSRPIDVSRFGIIYAGAQKNISHAGLSVVIIREDLIKEALPSTPTLFTYKIHADNKSLYNTPPTFAWYMAGLVFDWLKQQGGLSAIYEINKRKANQLYTLIEQHKDFYICKVAPECRSMNNVMFYLRDEALNPVFLEEAEKLGLKYLRGHRTSGGLRASIYNAMPEEGVKILADFMIDFARRKG